MNDLEQQCEDAVFEVCDARERFPLLCTKELEKCIKLTNEICLTKVTTDDSAVKTLDVPSFMDERYVILEKELSTVTEFLKMQDNKLQEMIDKVDNLKAALEQIKRDKLCEMNKILWN